MPAPRSLGTCAFCGATFTKAAMTNHLRSCGRRWAAAGHSPEKLRGKPRQTQIFHIVAQGRYQPEYWLHLEAPEDARLHDLDNFLRHIWLECCGHLSEFRIQGVAYTSVPMDEYDDTHSKGMNIALGRVLRLGMEVYHNYDFGTTTHLALRAWSIREGPFRGKTPRLLARNNPPAIVCNACGRPATQICVECSSTGEGWLCDECIEEHECGEEMLLPVVNSPRVGQCGYTGEPW